MPDKGKLGLDLPVSQSLGMIFEVLAPNYIRRLMDKIEKYKTMEKVLREIEDLKNSETAVIKKIGQIETENMNLNVQGLDKTISEIYDGIYKNLELVEGLHTSFTETVSDFKEKNNISDEMLLEFSENN